MAEAENVGPGIRCPAILGDEKRTGGDRDAGVGRSRETRRRSAVQGMRDRGCGMWSVGALVRVPGEKPGCHRQESRGATGTCRQPWRAGLRRRWRDRTDVEGVLFSFASKMGETGTNLNGLEDSIGRERRRGGSRCESGQSGAGHCAAREGSGILSRAGCSTRRALGGQGHEVAAGLEGGRLAMKRALDWREGAAERSRA